MRRWPFIFIALLVAAVARGQSGFTGPNVARSISGQFSVVRQPDERTAYRRLNLTNSPEIIRLEPAFLAVSAERFKIAVWRQLGLEPGSPWRGKINFSLRPARSLADGVTIASSPFLNVWTYRVDLPETLTRTRYARALAAVVLLEIANRESNASGRPAEIPAWLADGLARQTLATDGNQIILSTPPKSLDGKPPQSRINQTEHDFDPLAEVRRELEYAPALTFDQLSWPTAAQMTGDDGGTYFASAQLFTADLLQLKNGPAKMRAMLAQLPFCQNWQTAFFRAFREDFQRPLDVEKWWALQVVAFAARAPGPRWTTTVSRDRLTELLSVPVEFRSNSNALPAHAEISLQAAIRSLESGPRATVMQTKLRDLEYAQFYVAPDYAALTDGYRAALAAFLGEPRKAPVAGKGKQPPAMRRQASVAETLTKLDALDVRRRETDERVNSFLRKLRPGAP